MVNYELRMDCYQGPLDKLLELIEEKKLEISRVSLARVTADFLKYLKGLEEKQIDSSLLADFLVVASKLILIKSKELLPSLPLSEEEEEELKGFEWGLKIYQELKKTRQFIRESWKELPQMSNREFMANFGFFFYPPKDLKKEDLHSAIKRICQTLESFFKPAATIKNKIINLKVKIEEILKRITEKPISLQKLNIAKSKSEVVVLFLAVLHLIKDQLIQVEQETIFGDINISKKL